MQKLVAAAAVAALALAALFLRPPRPAEPAVRVEPPAPRPVRTAVPRPVVYVAGRVLHGGLYALASGARVDDAIRAAGGVTRDADPTAVNLAAHVADGEEILVPALGEAAAPERHPRRAKRPRHRKRRAVPSGNGDAAGDAASSL
jgi:competence protein ComEA